MLEITPTTKFKRDLKRFKHQPPVIQELNHVLALLIKRTSLPKNYVDHPLNGNWKGSRECHVHPDVLLIYRIDDEQSKLFLERFGSHSELF